MTPVGDAEKEGEKVSKEPKKLRWKNRYIVASLPWSVIPKVLTLRNAKKELELAQGGFRIYELYEVKEKADG